jgi:hypothetical protein
MGEYEPHKRMNAAIASHVADHCAESVRTILEDNPTMTGAEVLEELEKAAETARAELERWDTLRGPGGA